MPSLRFLVVDDFEPFRRFVCSTLETKADFQIVGEASDGLDAVMKAQELQPDLIVLDVGLPTLSGIEAARRIRTVSPQSKILFLSQESSAEIVREALATGAMGYVVKADVGNEFLTAVDAVLRGEVFVGSRFSGDDPAGGINGIFGTLQPEMKIARHHEAGFYSDDQYLLDELTQFIGAALNTGNAAIVVATESHRASLLPRLQAYGVDIGAAIEQGRFIALDAAKTLSTFMVNDSPDPVRFVKLLGTLIVTASETAKGEHARVAIFGEMCHLLWAQGNAEAAIRIEILGNQLGKTYDVDILCGYSLGSVQGGMESPIFQRICAEHSAVHAR